jgi:hypothetical protein
VTRATGCLSKKKRFKVSSLVSIVISQNISPFFKVLALSPDVTPGVEGRVVGFAGDKRALRRGESGGEEGRREKSYMTLDTGDLAVALPEEM